MVGSGGVDVVADAGPAAQNARAPRLTARLPPVASSQVCQRWSSFRLARLRIIRSTGDRLDDDPRLERSAVPGAALCYRVELLEDDAVVAKFADDAQQAITILRARGVRV